MPEFAEYAPDLASDPWPGVRTRPMESVDIAPVAGLHAERQGVALSRSSEVVRDWLVDPRRIVVVAEGVGGVLGYGKTEWQDPGAKGGRAPTGWYLSGLVVAPGARRHGVGLRLTSARIALLAERTRLVWYVAAMVNGATIDLHQRLGFVLHEEGIEMPGVEFTGGRGGLFRLDL